MNREKTAKMTAWIIGIIATIVAAIAVFMFIGAGTSTAFFVMSIGVIIAYIATYPIYKAIRGRT